MAEAKPRQSNMQSEGFFLVAVASIILSVLFFYTPGQREPTFVQRRGARARGLKVDTKVDTFWP